MMTPRSIACSKRSASPSGSPDVIDSNTEAPTPIGHSYGSATTSGMPSGARLPPDQNTASAA